MVWSLENQGQRPLFHKTVKNVVHARSRLGRRTQRHGQVGVLLVHQKEGRGLPGNELIDLALYVLKDGAWIVDAVDADALPAHLQDQLQRADGGAVDLFQVGCPVSGLSRTT